MSVAGVCRRYLLMSETVRPGMVCSSSLCASAWSSVAGGGEPSDWWMNWMYSLGLDKLRVCVIFEMMCSVVGFGVGASVGTLFNPPSGIIHRPVVVHLCPQIIVRPLCLMVQPSFVNVTSHPALQRLTTEMRECEARFGRMCAWRALSGSCGSNS